MILDFDKIRKEDVSIVGGKGANLGEMTSIGMNVPKGFVITAELYQKFIKENDKEEIFLQKLLEAENEEKELLSFVKEFRKKIREGSFPKEMEEEIRKKYENLGTNIRVAVRSSATAEDLEEASFAGQQESYLNVQGIEELLDKIRHCYASLWGDRAVSYRFHQNYKQSSVAIAVVIQVMIESEKSGVLFTVNPLTQKENEIQINANYGLGESVVSGRVTADSYIVDKSGKILETTIGSKETQIVYGEKNTKEVVNSEEKRKECVLNQKEIEKLLKEAIKIEEHYSMPMDIEWAIQGNKLYILQARAITTLKKIQEEERIQKYLKHVKLKGSIRANLSFLLEKMPFAYRALDFDYMIAINDQKAKIFSEVGILLNSNPKMDDNGILTLPDGKKRFNRNIFKFFSILKKMKNFAYCYHACKNFMSKYEEAIENIKKLDFAHMNLEECKEFMEYSYTLLQNLAYDRFKYALFPSVLGSKELTKRIKKVDEKYSAFDFYWELESKTVVITNEIGKMAEEIREQERLKKAIVSGKKYQDLCQEFPNFEKMIKNFLAKHGFKSDYNCYCIEAKTFMEDTDRLVNILRPILQGEGKRENKQKEKNFKNLMRNIQSGYGKKFEIFEEKIQYFRYFHVVREETQYLWECLFYHVRECVKRANFLLLHHENYKIGIANLFHEELITAMERGFLNETEQEKIERRNQNFPLASKVWEAEKLLVFDMKGEVLKGVSGSTGHVIGKACIISGPEEFYKMKQGDILVCHFTDPEWTPLFQLASAVVADTGAALSHAAIVAREFNIPAVLGVGFATTKFKDGDMIEVDGNQGEVRGC